MSGRIAVVLYVVAMAAVIAGPRFPRSSETDSGERLMANYWPLSSCSRAFYLRFLRHP